MAGTIKNISKDNLIEKLLIQKRGGLCYELNSLLYYFLIDCGFQVYKVAGTVYDLYDNKWKPDDGHVIIILSHEDKDYVVDAGYASHLPLHPVLLTEKSSPLKQENIEFVSEILEKVRIFRNEKRS